jgi:glycosyltransferase involved in cell wall biosynthesis
LRLAFLSSTPQNIARGSGTYVGIRTLKRALESCGVEVELFTPGGAAPMLTARRLIFNQWLRSQDWSRFDAVVGFDMDGFRIAGRTGVRHIASIKGVIADELRFERGVTRALLSIQARCEREHARRADRIMTTSRYSAGQIQRFYGVKDAPAIVPELIDLRLWQVQRLTTARFTVLSVCHLYPRKRIDLLIQAAQMLRDRLPELEVRIVGAGPVPRCDAPNVRWLGQVFFEDLRAEYASAGVFCLPSVQEGFGVVFLEAMAAGVPIVAARAAAVPEVVPQGVLVEPESASALAGAIEKLYRDPAECERLRLAGLERVKQFDAPLVAKRFLEAITAS